ncbi:MAG: hypothetical protein ACD_79C01511G0001 [uncultured bacterium]|nr:MAG: hypothetical protein ACD_79C01511G0001 [uncultured bacterium]
MGIPLYGESKGKVWHYKHWSGYSKTAMAMGHEIMVTPLQMAAAISTIANRGKYVRPKLVKSLVSSNGEISKDFDDKDKEGREIIRPQVVFKLNEALKMVTSEGGTAIKAGIEGYPVAGKTGTAQKLIEGRYSHSKYISSFYGYLPADNPRISITVMIDEPSGRTYGGDAAAPVFSRIGEKAILYFDPPAFDKSLLETKEGSVEEKDAA